MKIRNLFLIILASGSLGAADISEQLFQKQLDLTKLTRQINEKFEYIALVGERFIDWMHKEDDSFINSLDEMVQEYYKRKKNNNLGNFIIPAVLNKHGEFKNTQFRLDARRFLWISSIVEYKSLELLLQKYEKCLEEIAILEGSN